MSTLSSVRVRLRAIADILDGHGYGVEADCVRDAAETLRKLWCKCNATMDERETRAIVTSNGATGHCKCELCEKLIDPWDRYCRYCGAKIVEVER